MVANAPPVATIDFEPTNLPFIMMNTSLGEDAGAFAVGGIVFAATAGAALLNGDAVFWSAAAGVVNKSTTAGDRLKRAGIIVGAVPRSMFSSALKVIQRLGDIGLSAGILNDPVLVCTYGMCYAVADGVIAAGAQVTFSATTAGRVTAAASAAVTDAMGAVGVAIDAAGAGGDKIRVLVRC